MSWKVCDSQCSPMPPRSKKAAFEAVRRSGPFRVEDVAPHDLEPGKDEHDVQSDHGADCDLGSVVAARVAHDHTCGRKWLRGAFSIAVAPAHQCCASVRLWPHVGCFGRCWPSLRIGLGNDGGPFPTRVVWDSRPSGMEQVGSATPLVDVSKRTWPPGGLTSESRIGILSEISPELALTLSLPAAATDPWLRGRASCESLFSCNRPHWSSSRDRAV